MGDGIKMAIDIGARAYGNWSGCHSVGWDISSPEYGDYEVLDNFQKHSNHRALDDIRDSIDELRYYRKTIFKL